MRRLKARIPGDSFDLLSLSMGPSTSYISQWLYDEDQDCLYGCGIHGQFLSIWFRSRVVVVQQSSSPESMPLVDGLPVAYRLRFAVAEAFSNSLQTL